MLDGTLALILNVLAIALVCFALHNVTVSAIVSLLNQRFLQLQVPSRKATLWLLVSVPWLSALCTASYFYYAANNNTLFENQTSVAHWHHVDTFSWLSWHGLTLASAIGFLSYIVITRIATFSRHRSELAHLVALSERIDNNTYEIQSTDVAAFTAGFIKPKCFITQGMRQQTTEQEQTIILKHEIAHAKRRDPFKKWLFSILCAFYIPIISKRLSLHMTLAMEQEADNAVICSENSSLDIAGTLVKVARLNASGNTIKNTDMVANFGADVLEQRVYFLLGQLNLKPVNKLLMFIIIVATFFLCLSSVDGLHHFIEAVFKH